MHVRVAVTLLALQLLGKVQWTGRSLTLLDPNVCVQIHSHHCVCVRASTDLLEVFLFRLVHSRDVFSRGFVFPVSKHFGWCDFHYFVRHGGVVFCRGDGATDADVGPDCVYFIRHWSFHTAATIFWSLKIWQSNTRKWCKRSELWNGDVSACLYNDYVMFLFVPCYLRSLLCLQL